MQGTIGVGSRLGAQVEMFVMWEEGVHYRHTVEFRHRMQFATIEQGLHVDMLR